MRKIYYIYTPVSGVSSAKNVTVTFPFEVPVEKSTTKIVDEFSRTKKYSNGFLNDLKEGLSKSNYFVK